MFYELSKFLSDIAELLIAYASNRIDIEQLHTYISDDVDMYIKLNSNLFKVSQPVDLKEYTNVSKN